VDSEKKETAGDRARAVGKREMRENYFGQSWRKSLSGADNLSVQGPGMSESRSTSPDLASAMVTRWLQAFANGALVIGLGSSNAKERISCPGALIGRAASELTREQWMPELVTSFARNHTLLPFFLPTLQFAGLAGASNWARPAAAQM